MKHLFLFLLFLFSSKAFSQAGTLDPDFGNGGILTLNIGNRANADAMALQPDGKVVLAGFADVGRNTRFALMRILPDGSPDPSFGIDGVALSNFDNTKEWGYAVAIQSDGRIVVAGNTYNGPPNYDDDFTLARYLPDGTPDASFGNGGKVKIDGGSSYESFNGLTIQPDGKIIGVGFSQFQAGTTGQDFAILRFNPDGSLDTSFGNNGAVFTDINSSDNATDVLVQPDGKIVVAGSNGDFVALRYNSDGTPDSTFDGDGKVTTSILLFTSVDAANSIALLPDGKILLGGTGVVFPSPANKFALVRYNPDGTLDNSFDGDGKATVSFGAGDAYGNDISIQSDGKIVMAGIAVFNNYADFALARFTPDGFLDNTFGVGGKMTVPVSPTNDNGRAVAVAADGKIWVAGYADGALGIDFALLKLDTLGTPDTQYNSDGIATYRVGKSRTQGNALSLQPDGKLIAAGFSSNSACLSRFFEDGTPDPSFGTNGETVDLYAGGEIFAISQQPDGKIVAVSRSGLARYMSTGVPDSSFGQSGRIVVDFGTGNDYLSEPHALALQPDGKIIVAGGSYQYDLVDQSYFAVARYNPDGSYDNTFDGDGRAVAPVGTVDLYALCEAVAIQPDGKIVAAGWTYYDNYNVDFTLVRFLSDGTLDNTFSGDGKVNSNILGNDFCRALVIQPDGKILAAGESGTSAPLGRASLARYLADGSLDPAFSGDGKATLATGGNYAGLGVALQADGKIVVAGTKFIPGVSSDLALFRLLNNGNPDGSFGNNGIVTADLGNSDEQFNGIVIQPDNKIVVTGMTGDQLLIARYLPGSVVDVEEPDATQQITIQPNPASGFIEIETDHDSGAEASIFLYDSNGRLLRSASFENNLRWDIRDLPAGMYWVRLQEQCKTGMANFAKQFIKH